jgi:hypothetical protein
VYSTETDEKLRIFASPSEVLKSVKNWGYLEGFEYVAYKIESTRNLGGTYVPGIYIPGNEYVTGTYISGTYFPGSDNKPVSTVLVIGISDIQESSDISEDFIIVKVPSTPYKELTETGIVMVTIGSILIGIALIVGGLNLLLIPSGL